MIAAKEEEVSTNAHHEGRIQTLENETTHKRELIEILNQEAKKQEARLDPAKQRFESIELLSLMPKPRATPEEATKARYEFEEVKSEVELKTKRAKAAIIAATEELEQIERDLELAREEYKRIRIDALNKAFFGLLERQMVSLETLLHCSKEYFQLAREAQSLFLKFSTTSIFVDGANEFHISGFVRNLREILNRKVSSGEAQCADISRNAKELS